MNKLTSKFSFIFMTVFACVMSLSSCGSDVDSIDEDKSSTLSVTTLQNYFWYRAWTDVDQTSVGTYTNSFYFVTGNKGAMAWTEKTVDTTNGDDYSSGERYFSYTVSGNTVIIKWLDTNTMSEYIYSAGSLKNGSGDILLRKTLSTSDKTYIQELKTKLEQATTSLVGSSYKNTDISGGMATFTLTFTSATACTLKFSGHNTVWTSISGSATGTYTNASGVITVSGVYPYWDGSTATIKKGAGWSFTLRPVGAMYQDNTGTYWTK